MDETVCPKCNSEETYMDYEWVYEKSFAVRKCEECHTSYKIKYRVEAVSIEVM